MAWRALLLLAFAAGATGSSGCARAAPRTAAEYAARAADLREDVPPGFTVVVAPPFIVAGDGPSEAVRTDARETIGWAARLLRADFFDRDPEALVTVWLFDGEESYMRNANVVFGDVPRTPYGYYSPWDDALVINAASGRGTLVHEMVHPFVAADFPGCPPWLNEGLASLFEQPEERDGHLRGKTNWRLARLQIAIELRTLPPFAELLAMDRGDFYGDRAARNYAQARYLLYYLQERGLLVTFYRRLRAARDADPTGLASLGAVLGERDLLDFQRRWERFVLALEFPEPPAEKTAKD